MRYALPCVALRHPGLHDPNDGALGEAKAALRAASLRRDEDERGAYEWTGARGRAGTQAINGGSRLLLPGGGPTAGGSEHSTTLLELG